MYWKARCAVSLVALSAAVLGPAQTISGFGKWFNDQIANRITIQGERRIAYHQRTVSGDLQAYNDVEYGGQGLSTVTDFGNVHVTGAKVLGFLNFELNIQDSRFQDPQANRLSADIEKGPWTLNFGDIHGSLSNSNRFARFDKSLSGGQIGFKGKNFQVKALYSDVRGQPRTVSVQGNNSAGPYYLQSSQIVRGSEQVLVDGVLQVFGEDYTMDYDLGSILFVNKLTFEGRIIPPTSTIVATYEVLGFNGSRGTLEGISTNIDLKKSGRIGMTVMRQKQGGKFRDDLLTQRFLPPMAAGTPLFLDFAPADPLALKLYIGSTLQVLGDTYEFNEFNTATIILKIDVIDKIVTIIYKPKPVNTVQGDRDIVGLDYSLPLGDRGQLAYYQAVGRLTNAVEPKSGTARGFQLEYKTGKTEFTGSFRDVPDGFVGIETATFNRNERATQVGIHVTPSDRFQYGIDHQNARIQTTGLDNAPVSSRFSDLSAYIDVKPKGTRGLPWKLTQERIASNGPNGEATVDSTSLGTSGQKGRADWKLDLMNQFANGYSVIDTVRAKRNLNIQTLAYRLNYRAARSLDFNVNTSLSRVATTGVSSMGRDLLFGASYRPNEKFAIRAEVADSDAGQLATLGFISGSGFGYGGNGFSGGADESNFNESTNARNANLSMSWAANDKLSFTGNLNYYRTSGGVSSNVETKGVGFGANWNLNNSTDIDLLFDSSTTSFLDSPLVSSASTINFYVNGNPKGRFSYRGGINVLLTSGNSQFRQDSVGYEMSLNYLLAKRHSVNFSMDNGRLTGYLPQETRNMALTYQYQIWRTLALNIGYRIIDVVNRDKSIVSGEYSSRGFDIELQFNFGR